MKRQQQAIAKTLALSIVTLSGAMSLGQNVPTNAQPQGQAATGATRRNGTAGDKPAVKTVNNNTALQAGANMARTGGSLLKATLATAADPGQAKLSQVSFFAVPEPEPKVLRKHDLVTIIIREESEATSKGLTDVKKNAQLQAEVAQMIKLKLSNLSVYGLPSPSTTPGVDITGTRTFHGEGEVDRSDSLTARITAEILDVKPNGTLVVQARKSIKTDDEVQQFVLTGTCRAEDINPDNTILSTQLYDLLLQKNSKGDVRAGTERGRLPKLLDFINPF